MQRQTLLRLSLLMITIAASVAAIQSQSQSPAPAQSPAQSTTTPTQEVISEPSLADVARKLKAERAKGEPKPVKVFTNADLPTGPDGISIVGSSAPAGGRGQPGTGAAVEPESRHGETYYARVMGKLQAKLDLHRRELAVLQQKLNLAEPQYYPDPNKGLMQQYSRSDINKLAAEVEAKKPLIAEDEKAIADLGEQLRREGGDPGWLGAGALSAERGQVEPEELAPAAPTPGAKKAARTRAYWQGRFKSARARLKEAQEQKQLAEDELALLRTRQATELSDDAQRALAAEIPAKQGEVESKQAATAKAMDALEALEKEFKESGVPEEWTEPTE